MFYKLLTSLLVVVFPSFKGNAQNAINSSTRKEQISDHQKLIQLLVVHDQQRVHYSKEVERTFTTSLIFSETDHLIYLIDFIGEPAIGILKKTDFETVSQLCKKLDIKYYELNGQKQY